MLRYFQETFQPFIQVKLEYWGLKLKRFNQLIKKGIEAKSKVLFWPCATAWEMDQYCPRDSQPANFTITESQNSVVKNPWVEELQVQGPKSLSDFEKA